MNETIVIIAKLLLLGVAIALLGCVIVPIITAIFSILGLLIRLFIIPSVFMLIFWACIILGFLIIVSGG
jgi:hypothetical protein